MAPPGLNILLWHLFSSTRNLVNLKLLRVTFPVSFAVIVEVGSPCTFLSFFGNNTNFARIASKQPTILFSLGLPCTAIQGPAWIKERPFKVKSIHYFLLLTLASRSLSHD